MGTGNLILGSKALCCAMACPNLQHVQCFFTAVPACSAVLLLFCARVSKSVSKSYTARARANHCMLETNLLLIVTPPLCQWSELEARKALHPGGWQGRVHIPHHGGAKLAFRMDAIH